MVLLTIIIMMVVVAMPMPMDKGELARILAERASLSSGGAPHEQHQRPTRCQCVRRPSCHLAGLCRSSARQPASRPL